MPWSRAGYIVLLGIALLWTVGIAAAPLLHQGGCGREAVFARWFFSPICHQDVARSFALFDWPLSVCQRCSAIYSAFTLTVLAFPWLRRLRFFHTLALPRLAIFILPMLLDYMLDVAGVWNNSPVSRAVSGSIAGAGLACFVVPAWMELWT